MQIWVIFEQYGPKWERPTASSKWRHSI